MTADFITPPVDDPHLFGRIAAANSLSDVYAMGGRPLVCLNLVAFPGGKLEPKILAGIVEGALEKVTEAGAVLAGGHSTDDDEPKFGLAVTGTVHPDRVWTNAGARVGDALILTKPIGSGVLFNANLKGWVSREALDACLDILTTLNKTAAETLQGFEIHAATDVTGFGLAGHAFEMAEGSDVTLRIDLDAVPMMDEALRCYERGMTTGVNAVNRELVDAAMRFERDLPTWHEEIVVDPQTSGGLLVAGRGEQAADALEALHAAGVAGARIVGRVEAWDGRSRLVWG